MSLFWAELRKVWGNRLFPLLLAVLAAPHPVKRIAPAIPTAKKSLSFVFRSAFITDHTFPFVFPRS